MFAVVVPIVVTFLIIQPIEFLSAIVKQLKTKQIQYKMRHVVYSNCQYFSGKLNFFSNPDCFNYKNEFRIVLYTNSSEALAVSIGNIESYAHLFSVSEIDNAEVGVVSKW